MKTPRKYGKIQKKLKDQGVGSLGYYARLDIGGEVEARLRALAWQRVESIAGASIRRARIARYPGYIEKIASGERDESDAAIERAERFDKRAERLRKAANEALATLPPPKEKRRGGPPTSILEAITLTILRMRHPRLRN